MKHIRTKTISYDSRARIFWTLVSFIGLSVGLYLYAVVATIHHTIAREDISTAVSALSTKVSELEFRDIAIRNKVSLGIALEEGFVEVKSPLYVSRDRSASLTLNTARR